MIINSVTIENFRCYSGISNINFNNKGKITLIYGDSGFGKSSFLQFFRWMFYGDPDFGKDNDKPLFNIADYSKKKPGDKIKVAGKIDFDHLGVKYSLIKEVYYDYAINPNNARVFKTEYSLQHLINDSWQRFNGDIPNKINNILPKGLSKYFLLDGEKSRDIVLNSKDLKLAIHQLFGLDAYENAISHIGNKNKKNSVLGFYNSEMTSKMTTVALGLSMSPAELQETIQDQYDLIELDKAERKNLIDEIEDLNKRKIEIIKTLGQSNNKGNLAHLITSNEEIIKQQQKEIFNYRHEIGDLFYKHFPYLLLSRKTSLSSAVLRDKNDVFAKSYKNIFENLKKDLLKEIKEKGKCVCGRDLDEESAKRIDDLISVMPPDSYVYQFGQFVSKSKNHIQFARTEILNYSTLVEKINECEQKVMDLESKNKEIKEELQRLDDQKDLVNELAAVEDEIKRKSSKKAELEGRISKSKFIYEQSNKQLEKILANANVSTEYSEKINFFQKIALALEIEKRRKEAQVKVVLNQSVKEIFKQLTTQTELDADKIQFVNEDFSLRTTYLTGGQLSVDVYSYVIGIVKSLQELGMENNENPIIIDAPFAFTGNTQSEHIFKTLPAVSRQTILLTLDLNKIKNILFDNQNSYEFYVIKTNKAQDSATIEKGDINAIKF